MAYSKPEAHAAVRNMFEQYANQTLDTPETEIQVLRDLTSGIWKIFSDTPDGEQPVPEIPAATY